MNKQRYSHIYVLERDDFSFREFDRYDQLMHCEEPDILDGLYEGWDSRANHLVFSWNTRLGIPELAIIKHNYISSFMDAVNEYIERCRVAGVSFSKESNQASSHLCNPKKLGVRVMEIRTLVEQQQTGTSP